MSTARIILDGRTVDRDAVLQRGQRAASGLHEIGVREGDTIALLLRNDFAFFEAQTAAAAVGAYCVPINWHGRTEEVRYVLDDALAGRGEAAGRRDAVAAAGRTGLVVDAGGP